MKSNTILVIILIIVVGAVGFYAGMKYAQSQRGAALAGRTGVGMYRQFAGANGANSNNQAVRGQILSTSNGTMTIKLADGSSKIVVLPTNVKISKQTLGSISDLKNGAEVLVIGTNNSDGSVTADNVSLNPAFAGRSGGPMNQIQPQPTQ